MHTYLKILSNVPPPSPHSRFVLAPSKLMMWPRSAGLFIILFPPSVIIGMLGRYLALSHWLAYMVSWCWNQVAWFPAAVTP